MITATATDPNNNTSEFSNAATVSLPEITIAENLAQNEGNSDTVDYTYTVSLSQQTTQDIVVNYTTNDGTATVADNDYVDNDGSLTFAANPFAETPASQTITVQVNGDITFEGDEVFNVSLDNPSYGNIITPSVTGTIANDDAPPSISVSDITVNEGDGIATFTVTASKISGFPVSFDYATINDTAAAGLEYTATTGSLTIPVGETSVSFDVPLLDDGLEEPDKTFSINLTNLDGIDVENSTLTATANILDDDVSPVLSLEADNINFTEGGESVAIASNITISDTDSTTLTTASINLANPLDPGTETLSIVGTLPANITASEYNSFTGELTLTGDASLADYQTALSQIVYTNTSTTPNTKPRQIEITVTDGTNPSNTAFSTVNLTTVNTPPVVNNDTVITRIDTPITFNITNNDFDPDGIIDPSTVELDVTDLNNQGNATVDEQGNLTFTPETGFTGSVNIPYSVQDDGGESATGEVSITVNTDTNQPPVTQNLLTEIIPNTATQVAIPALTASDFDGTITSFQITRLPENGQLQLNGETVTTNQTISIEDSGNLTFTSELGFVGLAEFEYTAFDDNNASDLTPAIVVIPVNSTNQLPVAVDNIASPNPGNNTPVTIPELTATDAEGTITAFRITKFPTNSTLLLNGQPLTTPEIAVADAANLSYIGGGNFTGDSFRYTAIDTQGTEDPTPATVTLPALTTENILPVTADKIGPIIPNVPTPVALPSLEGTDADGSIASFTITELPVGGQLLLGGTAIEVNQVIPADQADQLTFTPEAEFSGLTQFSYVATDDQGGTDETPATYNLVVNVTNLPPLPTNPPVPLLKNISTQVPLPPLATVNTENIASFTLVELPLGGTVFLNGEPVTVNQVIPVDQAGQLTFTSNLDFSGSTVLKFTATDTAGITSSQVGEVSFFILPNILPTVQPLELPSIIPTSVPIGLPTLVGSDEDGSIVSFTLQNIPSPSQGQLFLGNTEVFNLTQVSEISLEQAGSLRFEANTNFVGDIVLNYVANDNDGQSSEPTEISINVLVGTPSVDFDIPESEPIADEIIVADIPNNGTAIEIPTLTANDINGEIVSFSILELPLEAQGQFFLNGTVVTRLSQVTEITIEQASQLSFVPTPTFLGQVQLRYTATNSIGLSSSASRIILEVPSISSQILSLPTDISFEFLVFTATLAGLSQSYTFITESIALNAVETSIEGTEANDILIGVEISEQIVGLAGNDEINAFGGSDNLFGNIGNDILNAGNGNDIADGGSGEDVLVGGFGSDTLIGGSENDSLVGGSDNLVLPDTDGEDLLDGGEGDDTLSGNQGNDSLIGGEGNDLIYSGKDNDLASGEAGNDTIFGDLGNDTIVGGEGNDFLLGNQGNDIVSGGEGNDFIAGGKGDDILFGDQGNDEVYGDLGADVVYGNQGNDSLYGGEDNDTLIGGEGDDFLSGDQGDDILFGGEGSDIFALLLNSGSDVIVDFTDSQDLLGLSIGLSFDELTIEQGETATLIRFEGQLLVTLNRINSTLITEDDFTTI
ncbi:Ig-like domain-containing protein [Lyngbya sp. PCC 8106]|uniref:Ig-like domain-containing protein n=1 Tax=Lyngbya sp. (strain PCC 8106) TaxID=313612 RepID=UPI0000EAD4C5|nr:tandem-95 repeat protein [Lyngbya sp. PCC 8106]EAW33587.1 type I secretion target repeat protein [Lyngbya sp. PCC 8106]